VNAHVTTDPPDSRERIRAAVDRLEHVLPGQAPLRDFVHHNTLHGFEHLHFAEALARARELTGCRGYLPLQRYREFYAAGRITRDDLAAVLDSEEALAPSEILFQTATVPCARRDVYLAALLHPLESLTASQLTWQVEQMDALAAFQGDVAAPARERLLESAGVHETRAVADLWDACLVALDLEYRPLHPEESLKPDVGPMARGNPSPERSETDTVSPDRLERTAREKLDGLLLRVGRDMTLRGLLKALTGEDLFDDLRPGLIRQLAGFLDQGVAAWHPAERQQGFYRAWRDSADPVGWALEGLSGWRFHLEELPDDPLDAIVEELERLDLPRERWVGYLERVALELPGWSGMVLWRQGNPGYRGHHQPVAMLDYLAVRLVLERLFALRLCAAQWGVEPGLDLLRWQMRRCPFEFFVRHALFNERLPEFLAGRAQRLVLQGEGGRRVADQPSLWQQLALQIMTWQQGTDGEPPGYSVSGHAWPLFRLAQHLGLSGRELRALPRAQVRALLDCIGRLEVDSAGYIWLRAYENHYRDRVFNAIVNNQGRGRWADRRHRPSSQVVFCMDDREEGTRRHLEEVDPGVETLGAAAHFGVPHWWRGLDDPEVTALTPVVFVPRNEIREQARPGSELQLAEHRRRRGWRVRLRDTLHQEVRRNLLSSTVAIALAAPAAGLALGAKVLAPRLFGQWARRLQQDFDKPVPTDIRFTAGRYHGEPGPTNVQLGFTTVEQARRVGGFLRAIGLAQGFAPLVAIMGHGSDSDNNPHLAAYNCGACSGNHSGPNARLFAAIVNRPEVRALLRREQGIDIPDDCWFLGAEHDTCSERVTWYDPDRIPAGRRADFQRLERSLAQATRRHAQERCRKFFSAPRNPSPEQARGHVLGRGLDFSQARPELGHATNACAFIGRRSVSQGVFLDRRAFLISYDCTRDPAGTDLESLLLANGPVGAGINLEYYFSTVDDTGYGAGSKVTHNVAGFFGVMEGAGSDLRTGLPRQMTEVHEAMRLLVIVEAKTDVISAIYRRQPPLQELIGNAWLLLAAKDPDSEAMHLFAPATGWTRWEGPVTPLPTVKQSGDYCCGTMDPLEPVLVEQPGVRHAG
jgi:uncharacterized protein YbcC (UPF0753/DUF2309 family)